VGCVDQQPSGEPEVGDKGRQQQEPGDKSVVSGEEEEQGRVDNVSASCEQHGNTKVAREDSPHGDACSEQDHVHTSKDLLGVVSVLVDNQQQVGNLGSNRRHVVGVEVILDNLVKRTVRVQQDSGTDQEDDVGGTNSLLNNLEGTDGDSGGGVDTGSNNDQTKSDSNDNINDADNQLEEDSGLEHEHALGDFIGSLLGKLPLNEDPSNSDGGVNGANDRHSGEDTGGEGGPSKTLSSLFELLAFFFVGGIGFRHLDELLIGRHD